MKKISIILLLLSACIFSGNDGVWRKPEYIIQWNRPIIITAMDEAWYEYDDSIESAINFWNTQLGCQVFAYRHIDDIAIFNGFITTKPSNKISGSVIVKSSKYSIFEMFLANGLDKNTATSALIHELGHMLGLSDDSDKRSVMYPKRAPLMPPEYNQDLSYKYKEGTGSEGGKLMENDKLALKKRYCGN